MKNKNELITKDIKRLIFQIAIPSSIGMFFNTMYNVVDTFYVGKISTEAISALTYSFMIFFMLLSISFGLSSAITAYVGGALGKHKRAMAKIYVSNGISLFMLISFILSIVSFLLLEKIFVLMGATAQVLEYSLEYTYIILLGIVPMLIGLGANAALIALGDTKSYRNILIIGFFLNLIFDPLFIYGFYFIPALGVGGVALATVLIQYITLIYMMYKLYKTTLFSISTFFKSSPNIRAFKDLTRQAIPTSANMLLMSFGSVITMYFVSTYGFKAVAAFGIGYRVEQIILLPMLGLNTAVISIVSNNFGAKNFDRIDEVIHKSLKYGYIMSAIGVALIVFFGKYMIMVFDTDIEVIDIAYPYIIFESFIFFSFITLFISVSTLQGIKNPFIIPYVSFYRQIFMPLIFFYVVVNIFDLSIIYLWVSMFIIITSAAVYMKLYMKRQLELARLKA
ncbi:MATE family efflux transporter [Sulfurimonas aquatica]|uniref:Multidrug-efflux transporter n=1 Tax=Sulfurimonas aquatica TaxID=2672570 RepID=A0A975B1X6_9BACT|nr:MATE family efflux transporter [Sulfurimonas aquatica]QSZ42615.1 MATE family efflux transporter [Sulfurimonas aquatica]